LSDDIKEHLDGDLEGENVEKSVTDVLKKIPKKECIKKLKKYIERLGFCVEAEGDYFENFMK